MKLSELRKLVNDTKLMKSGQSENYDGYHELVKTLVDVYALQHSIQAWERAAKEPVRAFLEKACGFEVCLCIYCSIPWPTEPMVERNDGELICNFCYEHIFFTCESCDTVQHLDYCNDGQCDSCYHENDQTCGGCGDGYREEELAWSDSDDCYYCRGCRRSFAVASRDVVRDYSCDVTEVRGRRWLSAPGEATDSHGNGRSKTPTLWLGFELEVVSKEAPERSHGQCAVAVNTALGDRGILKEDGSIRGRGFEIVSLPGTLRYHQTEWGDGFFKVLGEHAKGWSQASCGMHVHMSRSALSHLQLGRIVNFIGAEINRPFIEKVAGRSRNDYCKIQPKKITDCRRREWHGVRGTEGVSYRSGDDDRYQAVNLQREETIEFRIFRSNVAQLGFLKNIEFCDAVAHFCLEASNTQLNKEHFLQWVRSHAGSYPNFIKWAVRENLLSTKHKPAPGAPELILTA